MPTDTQAFLRSELEKAVESQNQHDELRLVLLHYHQAMLHALQVFHPCPRCSFLDLSHLKRSAEGLQHTSFASIQEVMQRSMRSFHGLTLLCPSCRDDFQQHLLERFFEIRTQR